MREYWIETGGTKLIEKALTSANINASKELIKKGIINLKYVDRFVNLEDIKNSDIAFFSLLIHSGYLTKADEEDVYKMPNIEVKRYFY